jgi:hypothetical protein
MAGTRRLERRPPENVVDYPPNRHESLAVFGSERCPARARWPEGFRCPALGHDRYRLRSDGRYLRCACRRRSWFGAMWYVETGIGVSAPRGIRLAGVDGSSNTTEPAPQMLRRRKLQPRTGYLPGAVGRQSGDVTLKAACEPGAESCPWHRGHAHAMAPAVTLGASASAKQNVVAISSTR